MASVPSVAHRAAQWRVVARLAAPLGPGWPAEAPACHCCCFDHTFGRACPAYAWGACRGQGSVEEAEHIEGYAAWYMAARGWTSATFYNSDPVVQPDTAGDAGTWSM